MALYVHQIRNCRNKNFTQWYYARYKCNWSWVENAQRVPLYGAKFFEFHVMLLVPSIAHSSFDPPWFDPAQIPMTLCGCYPSKCSSYFHRPETTHQWWRGHDENHRINPIHEVNNVEFQFESTQPVLYSSRALRLRIRPRPWPVLIRASTVYFQIPVHSSSCFACLKIVRSSSKSRRAVQSAFKCNHEEIDKSCVSKMFWLLFYTFWTLVNSTLHLLLDNLFSFCFSKWASVC